MCKWALHLSAARGDKVKVVGMPREEDCEHDMLVNILWNERVLAVLSLNSSEYMLRMTPIKLFRTGKPGSIVVTSCKRL